MPRRRVRPPRPPAHLDAEAAREWTRIAHQLAQRGTVTPADVALLEGYVTCFARWRAAEAEIAKSMPVVRGPQGGAQQNPWLAVARAALRDARQCLAELGLTPLQRAKLKKAGAGQDDEEPDLSLLNVG